MKTVFTALAEHAAKVGNPAVRWKCHLIIQAAAEYGSEIQAVRERRERLRLQATLEPSRNGMLKTGEIHPVEWAACKVLCPDLDRGNGTALQQGLRWLMAQDWAQEFKASPIEKRFHGTEKQAAAVH